MPRTIESLDQLLSTVTARSIAPTLLYVGRSFRPADRFTKHRRKDWWQQVHWLTLLRVQGEDWRESGALTDRLERLAIRKLHPAYNIVGVDRG